MVPFVFTARENHGVKSVGDYLEKHAAFMAKLARRGARFLVHKAVEPIAARIDANRWLVDCSCGNCCATDPDWGIACCYACGAVYLTVTFPAVDDREQLEAVLVERTNLMDRAWAPGETLVGLVAENVSIEARVPDGVIAAIVADGNERRR
jgi:hypothetical protein